MKDYQFMLDKTGSAENIVIEMPPLPNDQTFPASQSSSAQDLTPAQINSLEEVPQQETIQESSTDRIDPVENDQERNYRALRAEAKRLRAENERLMREREMPRDPQESFNEPASDDIVEGKHLKYYASKIKQLESQLHQNTIEQRLKSQYTDFDKVVNEQTVSQLQDEYPELFQTIQSSNDLYNKAASAYTLIKKLGIATPTEAERERHTAIKNAAKPRTVTSIMPQAGNSPLSNANAFANGLTPELQAQLLKEMNSYRKGF
jgi:hypothetical protein